MLPLQGGRLRVGFVREIQPCEAHRNVEFISAAAIDNASLRPLAGLYVLNAPCVHRGQAPSRRHGPHHYENRRATEDRFLYRVDIAVPSLGLGGPHVSAKTAAPRTHIKPAGLWDPLFREVVTGPTPLYPSVFRGSAGRQRCGRL